MKCHFKAPLNAVEARDAWKDAFIYSERLKTAIRTLPFGFIDDQGIQKYMLLIQANLSHCQGGVSHVAAKSISREMGEADADDGGGR